MPQNWPARLWILRHGESIGNVARDNAMRQGLRQIDIADRDIDVPLSPLGKEQSQAMGRWFGRLAPAQKPDVILTSPYLRARQTAELIRREAGLAAVKPLVDERLREKEFGILDRLTTAGVVERFPEQAEFRRLLGKFYHRPPGGESWCDVILRLRGALDTVALHHTGKRVLVVGHQVVVLCLRYILEEMDEEAILAIDRKGDVANCAVTEYGFDAGQPGTGGLKLERYNFVAPLADEGATVTSKPDANVAAR